VRHGKVGTSGAVGGALHGGCGMIDDIGKNGLENVIGNAREVH